MSATLPGIRLTVNHYLVRLWSRCCPQWCASSRMARDCPDDLIDARAEASPYNRDNLHKLRSRSYLCETVCARVLWPRPGRARSDTGTPGPRPSLISPRGSSRSRLLRPSVLLTRGRAPEWLLAGWTGVRPARQGKTRIN